MILTNELKLYSWYEHQFRSPGQDFLPLFRQWGRSFLSNDFSIQWCHSFWNKPWIKVYTTKMKKHIVTYQQCSLYQRNVDVTFLYLCKRKNCKISTTPWNCLVFLHQHLLRAKCIWKYSFDEYHERYIKRNEKKECRIQIWRIIENALS